jgi:poly-beta-1,6-N-acetyl-D-glucosamine N-deacetylase
MLYKLFCYIVYWTGLPWIIRHFIAKRRVTIMLYHDPSRETFAKHVRYLSRNYKIISLDDLLECIEKGKPQFPDYAMVITFDDGHKGNAELIYTLNEHAIPVTIYLCSGVVNTNRKFWFRLDGLRSKNVKGLGHADRLEYLRSHFGYSQQQEYGHEDCHALSLSKIQEMKTYVSFQSHTCFHPILTTTTDEVAESEIRESKTDLQRMLDTSVEHFAFPNGDYSEREIELLKKHGYRSGRTTDVGWNDHKSDPFRLKITGVSDQSDVIMLKAEVSGIPRYFYNLLTRGISRFSIFGRHVPEIYKNENITTVRKHAI